MATITATEAKNRIGELWEMADHEPVIVERNGTPRYLVAALDKYVAIPRDEYDRLRGVGVPPRLGFAQQLLEGVDTDALLQMDLDETLREYL
jgi:hypothetical protein